MALIVPVLVIALGALMMASGIVKLVANNNLIFGTTDPVYEFFVGLVFILIAAFMLRDTKVLITLEHYR